MHPGQIDLLQLDGLRDWTVSSEELCQLFGVSKVAVHYWRKDGMPQRARGVYDLGEVIRWWRERFSERAVLRDGPEGQEKRALVQAQTRKYEVETKKLQGDLIPSSEVASVVHGLASLFRDALEGLGPRMASELAELKDEITIKDAIVRECRNILTQVSNGVQNVSSEGFHDPGSGLEDIEATTFTKRGRLGRRNKDAPGGEPGAGALED